MALNSYSQILSRGYETAPRHESMRKSSGYNSWDYYHYDRESYHYISQVLDSSVGKDFDKVFSDICNKFRKKKDYDFRREFLRRIDPYYMAPRRRWRYNGYYLDENRIIRRYDAPETKEIYLSSLLNSIEAERKNKESLENGITRDRLRFAEDSFTGEFYHGQKRKKRRQSQNTEKVRELSE